MMLVMTFKITRNNEVTKKTDIYVPVNWINNNTSHLLLPLQTLAPLKCCSLHIINSETSLLKKMYFPSDYVW